ncbi:PREDICTED: patellin-3-like isoform X2 [Camelina sativa]|uniref:Patellin-3-like isoform X1 n=1 Tax=Camelina sativa TaxID=90675 RepID=A0ABM0TLC9_CAMSA|nr:PREDICTED: patellin-3-like isoform X1 [Camelina sativa]XP_010428081.1 PREDICTED: patellin-3-like isoform X2 [Camelina sativa]
MAEEPITTTTTLVTPEKEPSSEASASTQEVLPKETEAPKSVTETDLPETATKPEEHHPPTVTETETASTEKKELGDEEASKKEVAEEKKNMIPLNLGSFKEESSKLSDLSDSEKKSLDELKRLVRDALDNHQFGSTPKPENAAANTTTTPEEVKIWGIPLLEDDRSDVVLLKFLRARDFKVKDSLAMLKNTIKWRREFKIDELVEEDLVDDLDKVVFMHGHDREGHPVCYNVYGEFQNKELYNKTFSDEEKRKHFLRTRIQFLERSIRKLDFSSGGVSTIFQVNDMKNSPGLGKKELRSATKQAVELLQDNYPEFVFKQAFINVPWWYLVFYTVIGPFMTPRSKSKLVFSGPSRSAETLFKYISPEQVPVQYGGLSVDPCDCNPDFSLEDAASEITVKPGTKQTVEIIIYEKCELVWEIRVIGWEVSYKAEFVPEEKDAYTVVIQKPRKMRPSDEPVLTHSFKVNELGKVLLTVDNPTSKKKKLVYRFNVKPL